MLSDEKERERRSVSAQPNRKLSLMRSATMPSMPGLKREASEVPSLSSIPSIDTHAQSTSSKGVFSSNKRFGHREVDFGSLARGPIIKAQKDARIESELKNAIAALKKPNRELAGKSFADAIEKRAVPTSASRSALPFFICSTQRLT